MNRPNPLIRIVARIHRMFTQQAIELVTAVFAGALIFIAYYEQMSVSGRLSVGTFLIGVPLAAWVAVLAHSAVHKIRDANHVHSLSEMQQDKMPKPGGLR